MAIRKPILRILNVHNILTHYREGLFRELGKHRRQQTIPNSPVEPIPVHLASWARHKPPVIRHGIRYPLHTILNLTSRPTTEVILGSANAVLDYCAYINSISAKYAPIGFPSIIST